MRKNAINYALLSAAFAPPLSLPPSSLPLTLLLSAFFANNFSSIFLLATHSLHVVAVVSRNCCCCRLKHMSAVISQLVGRPSASTRLNLFGHLPRPAASTAHIPLALIAKYLAAVFAKLLIFYFGTSWLDFFLVCLVC